MVKNTDFSANDFQERVYRQFDFLKGLKKGQETEQELIKNNKSDTFWGCLFLPFIKFGIGFGNKFYLQQSEKYNYPENEKRAKVLLAHNEIREIICSALHKVGSKEILTEERMVKTVVESLGIEEIRNKFLIPLDETLFAFLSYELFQTGLERYCQS